MEALEESPAADDGAVGRGAWCFVRATRTRPTVFFEFFFFFHPLSLRTAARYALPWQLSLVSIYTRMSDTISVSDRTTDNASPSITLSRL